MFSVEFELKTTGWKSTVKTKSFQNYTEAELFRVLATRSYESAPFPLEISSRIICINENARLAENKEKDDEN